DLDRRDASAADLRHQTLGNYSAKCLRQTRPDNRFFVLWKNAYDTVDRFCGINRMKRRKHKVAGFGRFESDLDRFAVTHFTDENYLRSLTQRGSKSRCKIGSNRMKFTLVDRA